MRTIQRACALAAISDALPGVTYDGGRIRTSRLSIVERGERRPLPIATIDRYVIETFIAGVGTTERAPFENAHGRTKRDHDRGYSVGLALRPA